MNIENEFLCVAVYLEMAEEKWQAKQYCASLVSLTKAYPHLRSLIEKLYNLDRVAAAAKLCPEDNP